MEDFAIIILVTLISAVALVGAKMFRPNSEPKRAKKEVQDSAQKELISSKDLTIKSMQSELRRINGKLARTLHLESQYEEETPEVAANQVTWEEIQALVKASYPKYSMMLPLAKDQIMNAVEGKSMEEVLTYVKQFTGDKQPQEGTPQIAWDPNSA